MTRTQQRRGHPVDRPTGRRGRIVTGAAVVLVGVLALGWWLATRPDAVTRHADQLRQEQAVRDLEQVDELTELARRTSRTIVPAVEGLDRALSAGSTPAPDELEAWRTDVATVLADWSDPPSGSTELNVARSSFATSLDLLDVTLTASAETAAGGVVSGEDATAILARQLELVVRTWSTAATQLDWLNVEVGRGHQHVFLPVASEGALTADPAAEGSGAHHDAD